MAIVRSYKNRRKKHVCVNKVYENKKKLAAALDSTVKKMFVQYFIFQVLFFCFVLLFHSFCLSVTPV